MSEVKVVDTSKYTRSGSVLVDGMSWTVELPGAGRELEYSKMMRRANFLQKKVDAGTADEKDLDRLDGLEEKSIEYFAGIFKDGTKDNSQVKEWIDKTPMGIIIQSLEDIKSQVNEVDTAGDGA